eukprot:m.42569 g.42569  ORF g.42569 m.42569 type:complete len:83 (+) comp7063_c0_seq7:1999-2247(+)
MSAITAKAADMNPLMLPTVCVGSVASICNHNVPSIGAHPTTRSHHIIILIRHQYNHNSLNPAFNTESDDRYCSSMVDYHLCF